MTARQSRLMPVDVGQNARGTDIGGKERRVFLKNRNTGESLEQGDQRHQTENYLCSISSNWQTHICLRLFWSSSSPESYKITFNHIGYSYMESNRHSGGVDLREIEQT